MPVVWSRRAVLLGLGTGALSALAGCSVRLEHDAPHLPFVPTLEPAPDQAALLAALHRARSLRASADRAGGAPQGLPAQLAALHGRQVQTLEQLLRADNVPIPAAPTPPVTPSAKGTATSTKATKATKAAKVAKAAKELGVLEAGAVTSTSLARLAEVSSANLGVLGTLLAQQAAAGTLLGHAPAWPVITGPTRDPAAALLTATRSAVYGFQVLAARTPLKQRGVATTTLTTVRSQSDTLETLAGTSAAPPPMGYQLPFPVTDAASRRRLGQQLLTRLIASTASILNASSPEANAAAGVVQLLSAQVVLGARWGVPLTPFPGLEPQ